MATKTKKQTRAAAKKKQRTAAPREGEAPAQQEDVAIHSSGKMRMMVTWHGSEGEGDARPEPKQWYGMKFEQGKPVSVEHLAPAVWDSMRRDIDGGDGWSYEYVVEHEPEEIEPPPEPPPPDPTPARRGR